MNMNLLRDDFVPLKCPMCRRTVIKLIKEHVPKKILERYKHGICRDCKKKVVNEYKEMFKD